MVSKGAAAAAVGIARILIKQDGKITVEQVATIAVTELVGAAVEQVAHAKPRRVHAASTPGAPGAPAASEGWTIVVRHTVDGAVRTSAYRVASGEKLHVLTNGKTVQSFEPDQDLVTIEAQPGTSTAIAVVDSLDQPKRSSGKFRLAVVGNYSEYDFDTDKRSGGQEGSDVRLGFGGASAAHGAVYAKFRESGEPSLADCATVRPDDWRGGLDGNGKYCMRTSEGRFGRLKIDGTVIEYSYTVWQTTAATPLEAPR